MTLDDEDEFEPAADICAQCDNDQDECDCCWDCDSTVDNCRCAESCGKCYELLDECICMKPIDEILKLAKDLTDEQVREVILALQKMLCAR